MTYTKDNPNKFFLNDKSIAQELKYGDIQINAIPSLDLVSSLYNQLSTEDKRQNDYIVSVETSAYAISSIVDSRLKDLNYSLSTYVNSICTSISTQVDDNRVNDKKELSNVLSTYVNTLTSVISIEIDTNRAADYISATNKSFEYVSNLSDSISNFIDNAKYSVVDKVGFTYNDQTHIITLSVADQFNNSNVLSIDSSDFIKNRIVDHVDVVTKEQDPSLSETVLRIWWVNEGSSGIYTDIPISQLAKVYTAGTGINITTDLKISVVNYDELTGCLNQTSSNVAILSNSTIVALDNRVEILENYATELSTPVTGKLDTIISLVQTLSDNVSADIKTLSTNLVTDINAVSSHADSLQEYVDTLSGNTGSIAYLSGKIDTNANVLKTTVKNAEKIQMSKYEPDWVIANAGNNYISALFKYGIPGRSTTAPVVNGSTYQVSFLEYPDVNPKYVMSNELFAADQYYDTNDGVRLGHNCYIVISGNANDEYIELSDITKDKLRIFNDDFYIPYKTQLIAKQNSIWLSGNNNITSVYDISVHNGGTSPEIITKTGHGISGSNDIGGNNHFLDGNNIFDGYNYIEALSVNKLSANDISTDNIYVNFANVNDLGTNKNKYSNLCAFETSVELSTQNLSAYICKIQNNVNKIYCNVSSITLTSQLSDVISAVVEIAHKLSTITDIQY